MRRKLIALSALALAFTLAGAAAEEPRSEVSLEGTGFFTKDSNGNGISQDTTKTGGFLVGYRFHINRWHAVEANYGYSRNTQRYQTGLGLFAEQTNVHEATASYVLTIPTKKKFKPFLLAGGGALVFDPTNNAGGTVPGAVRQARAAAVYGGGVDYILTRRIALRAQYRGLIYKSPDFELSSLHTDKITHTAQPSAGIVFRF